MSSAQVTAQTRYIVAAAALWVATAVLPANGQVVLQARSASVAQPGEVGHICVYMATNGQKVAGIQSRLIWDGTCATLPEPPPCYAVGSHGKQVHAPSDLRTQAEFTVNVLVLSLGNVDPMPDGPVYCCDFQGEADPGQCCNITLTNTQASDPGGVAIGASGGRAQICTQGSNQPAGGFGSPGGGTNQPLSASNEPPAGQINNAPPVAAPAGPAAPAGGPINQVLPGGGTRVENPAPAPPQGAPAVLPMPGTPVALQPAGAGQTVGPAAPIAPPVSTAPEPTSAATAEVATPAPLDTPTPGLATESTAAPTKAAPAAQNAKAKPTANAQPQARDAAQAEGGGGWFGCQIVGGASPVPVLGLGLLAVIGVVWRRRVRRGRGSRAER